MYTVFNMTDSESINDNFDSFGYGGTNFMFLTGSLFVNQCIAIGTFILSTIVFVIVIGYPNKAMCRKIGMNLPKRIVLEIILRLYIDGYLDIIISCLISLQAFS